MPGLQGYHGTSEIKHSLSACTVDNSLAKARGLSLRNGAQTMFYLSHRPKFRGVISSFTLHNVTVGMFGIIFGVHPSNTQILFGQLEDMFIIMPNVPVIIPISNLRISDRHGLQ